MRVLAEDYVESLSGAVYPISYDKEYSRWSEMVRVCGSCNLDGSSTPDGQSWLPQKKAKGMNVIEDIMIRERKGEVFRFLPESVQDMRVGADTELIIASTERVLQMLKRVKELFPAPIACAIHGIRIPMSLQGEEKYNFDCAASSRHMTSADSLCLGTSIPFKTIRDYIPLRLSGKSVIAACKTCEVNLGNKLKKAHISRMKSKLVTKVQPALMS